MNGTSKVFYGTWPEGRRTIRLLDPLYDVQPPKKRVKKANENVGSKTQIAPLRNSFDESEG